MFGRCAVPGLEHEYRTTSYVSAELAFAGEKPTVWLGMWWALTTVTTVGYGDVVPQDSIGRVIASFLLRGGLALLSVVTATITSGFVARAQRETPAMPKSSSWPRSASCERGSTSSPSA